MKQPTFAPAYAVIYPGLCQIARSHGYALAIHGSVSTDCDLLASPWTFDAEEPATLLNAICKYLNAVLDIPDGNGVLLSEPEQKPHGRLAWAIPIGNGAVMDLSVTPRTI